MKELSKEDLKNILVGIYYPISQCAITCPDGSAGSMDCGDGTMCVADPAAHTITCNYSDDFSVDYCPCDVPKT